MRDWTDLEKLFLDERLLDEEKNPEALRCLFCHSTFRFEDQIVAHTWAKHRKELFHEIKNLRKELNEVKEAMIVYRTLARDRKP